MEALAERILDRPGSRVFYRWRPSRSGHCWVFLHGAGMDGHMFDAQLPAVPERDGIVCWDARGHGRSTLSGPFGFLDMHADLEALVHAAAASAVILVGQSLGAHLAQFFTAKSPDAVAVQVLIGCTDNHGPLDRLEHLGLAHMSRMFRLIPWGLTVRWSAASCGTEPATRAYVSERLRALGRERLIEVMDFWREALRCDPDYRLPVPTLGLVGAKDTTGSVLTSMTSWPRRDPGLELVLVPHAAHNANQDRPSLVNRSMVDFVGRHAPV